MYGNYLKLQRCSPSKREGQLALRPHLDSPSSILDFSVPQTALRQKPLKICTARLGFLWLKCHGSPWDWEKLRSGGSLTSLRSWFFTWTVNYIESWIYGRYYMVREFIMVQLIGSLYGYSCIYIYLYIHINILIYSIELVIWVIWV